MKLESTHTLTAIFFCAIRTKTVLAFAKFAFCEKGMITSFYPRANISRILFVESTVR